MFSSYSIVALLTRGQNRERSWKTNGVQVSSGRLYSVRHKAKYAYTQDVRDFYKLFFLCERADDAPPQCGEETIDVDFFARDALPPLSRGRVIEADIHMAFAFERASPGEVFFD